MLIYTHDRVSRSHLQNSVALLDARQLGGALLQHSADVLQRCVQLAVDGAQLTALRHLAAHVESEAGLRLVDGDGPRTAARFQRHSAGRLRLRRTVETTAQSVGVNGDDKWCDRTAGRLVRRGCELVWSCVCVCFGGRRRRRVVGMIPWCESAIEWGAWRSCVTAPHQLWVLFVRACAFVCIGNSTYLQAHAESATLDTRAYVFCIFVIGGQSSEMQLHWNKAESSRAPVTHTYAHSLALVLVFFSNTTLSANAGTHAGTARKIKETHTHTQTSATHAQTSSWMCACAVHGKVFDKIDNTYMQIPCVYMKILLKCIHILTDNKHFILCTNHRRLD